MKQKLVVFTGAGVSAESGIKTFRDSDGLWEQYKIEDVATPMAWEKNPALVTEFYNMRRKQLYESHPNSAHLAIAKLEGIYAVEVITQNVDNLHERAGSTNVLHLHGELSKVRSSGPQSDKYIIEQKHWEVKMGDVCPKGFQLRPHIVWFGEEVPNLSIAIEQIKIADIVVVVGTSLQVYPAAGIIDYAPKAAKFYLIDPNEVYVPSHFEVIREKATIGMEKLVKKLIS